MVGTFNSKRRSNQFAASVKRAVLRAAASPSALIEFQIRPSPSLTHYFYTGLLALSRSTIISLRSPSLSNFVCHSQPFYGRAAAFLESLRWRRRRRRFQGAGWPGWTERGLNLGVGIPFEKITELTQKKRPASSTNYCLDFMVSSPPAKRMRFACLFIYSLGILWEAYPGYRLCAVLRRRFVGFVPSNAEFIIVNIFCSKIFPQLLTYSRLDDKPGEIQAPFFPAVR